MSDDDEPYEAPELFRPKYRELDELEKAAVDDIKSEAQILLQAIDSAYLRRINPGEARSLAAAGLRAGSALNRSHAIARQRLEETIMWAVKGLTG